MKKVALNETPNGVLTSFTLAQDTVETNLVLGVYEGFLLRKVAASPGQGEYTKSGSAISMGFAPATGSSFYFFIQTDPTKGLGLYEVGGSKNGSNTAFTLPVAVPAGSDVILLHTNHVAEQVASSPGLGQFTRSGTAITWNSTFPPQDGDRLVAYIEEAEISGVNFALVTLTPTANPLVYDTDIASSDTFSPTLLAIDGGSYIAQISESPAAGECLYFDADQTIEFGYTPIAPVVFVTQLVPKSGVNLALLALLRDSRKTQIVLVEDDSLQPDGDPETHYYATEEYSTLSTDTPANTEYRGIVTGPTILTIERSLQEAFLGRSQLTLGDLRLANGGDLSSRFGLMGNIFTGHSIIIEIVGRREEGYAYADRGKILVGVKGEPRRRDGAIVIPIADAFALLSIKIPTAVLTTSEYANLPAALVGKPKPLIDGEVKHFEPLLIDPTVPRYLVAGHACEDVAVAVYDQGLATGLTVTPNHAGGYFDLSGTPTGKVTCDAKGRKISGTFSNKLWDIVENKLKTDANPVFATGEIDSGTFLFAKRDSNYACGIAARDQVELSAQIDKLVSSVIGWYVLRPDGIVTVGQLAAPSVSAVLSLEDVELYVDTFELTVVPPAWQIIVHYAPLETTFSDSEIAGAVTQAQRLYLKEGYKTLEWSDASIKDDYPQAVSKTIDTRLLNEADAQAILTLAVSLFSVRQARVSGDFNLAPLLLKLHDTVSFEHGDYDISGNWRTVKIRESYTATRGPSRVNLELWRPL